MTLLANRFPQGRFQSPGIDDAFIRKRRFRIEDRGWVKRGLFNPRSSILILRFSDILVAPDMELSRSMAALATDRITLENRLAIAIAGLLDRIDMVGMAEQTQRLDGTIELVNGRSQVRRQIPDLPFRVPTD